MKVYLDFMRDIPYELPMAGAEISTTIYMIELVQDPRDVVDLNLVRETAQKYQAMGVSKVVLDIEKVRDVPNLSAVWQLSNKYTRPQTVALWIELLTEFKQWFTGSVGIWGGHPTYWDVVGRRETYPLQVEELEHSWQDFVAWESDIRPIHKMTDFLCPGAYCESMASTPDGWTNSYLTKKRWWAECFKLMRAGMKLNHGDKPIEWFITPYPVGMLHDQSFINWQMKQIDAFGDPVHIWLGPEGKYPALADKMAGVIMGNTTND